MSIIIVWWVRSLEKFEALLQINANVANTIGKERISLINLMVSCEAVSKARMKSI